MLPTGDRQAAECLAPAGCATLDSTAAIQDRTVSTPSLHSYEVCPAAGLRPLLTHQADYLSNNTSFEDHSKAETSTPLDIRISG